MSRLSDTAEAQKLDFTIPGPAAGAPPCVNEAIAELIQGDSVALHGYTTAAGLPSLRAKIAEDLNTRFGTDVVPERIYVTCGGAAGLAIALRAVLLPGDEVLAPAPFLPEYRVFAEAAGGALVAVPPRATDFQIDLDAVEDALSDKTRAVVFSSPNAPSGVALSQESLLGLTGALRRHEEKAGHPIYLICDESFRETLFDEAEPACIFNDYDDAILCYSFGPSLAIPGERLGYLAVGTHMTEGEDVYAAVTGAARSMGYVNPPSLFQRVVERCLGQTADISQWRESRAALLGGLRALGYDCVEPQGGFGLFVKTPEAGEMDFCAGAARKGLLLSPGGECGVPGYVRLACCVPKEQIEAALPVFQAMLQKT